MFQSHLSDIVEPQGRDGLLLPVTRQRAPLNAFERAVKRTLDVVGSMTAILLLWPLFLIVAIGIKLDRRRSNHIPAAANRQAPPVTGLQPWKAEFWHGSRKIVTARFGKLEKV